MRPAIGTLALVLLLGSSTAAQQLPGHARFDSVLSRVVRDGLVDYGALRAGRETLDAYLADLGDTDTATLAASSRDARLAFWINAYNACALRLVIDHYPIKKRGFPTSLALSLQGVPGNSIRQIPNTWERAFCPVAGAERSLDEIEHEIIRPMGEPRIHFAVNCASRSCPVLAAQAYTASALHVQLDDAVRRFVTDERQFRLERAAGPRLVVNPVLDWYAADFGGRDGIVEFLLPYLAPEDARYLREHAVDLAFSPYDWTLNDTAVFGTEP